MTPSASHEVALKWVLSLRSGTSCDERVDDGRFPIMGAAGPIGRTDRANTKAGSIIIGRVGTVGAVNRVRTDCWASDNTIVATPGPNLVIPYAFYLLLGARLPELASKTAQPLLTASAVGNQRFRVPDLEEQRRIADFLDAETARVDQLMRSRRTQVLRLTERDYASISETLIPGSLTKQTGKGLFPWLPKLPEGLPMVKLGYICRIQNGLTVDGKRDVTGDDVVTRPYLRVANVQAGHVALDSVTEITVPRAIAERSTLRVGDVLMTEGGDLDKLGRGTVWNGELPDCLHQNHVFALRPVEAILDGHYLALTTQTLHGRCYFESTGTKTTNLASTNSSKILGFPIPLPSLKAQRDLVSKVHEELAATAKVRELLTRQLTLMAERRQALITAAVTGQFDITTASGRSVTEGVFA